MIRANDKGLVPPPVVVEGGSPRRRVPAITPRNLLVIVGGLAWIAVLVLFVVPQVVGKKAAPAAESGTAVQAISEPAAVQAQPEATSGALAAPKAVPAPELTINGRVFNLSNSAGYKYLKLSVVIQFADEGNKFSKAKGEALKKLEDGFAADNAGALDAFNDILTTTVSAKTAGDLATPQGKEALRQELAARFNQALAGKGRVTYINFVDFVMQ